VLPAGDVAQGGVSISNLTARQAFPAHLKTKCLLAGY